MLAESMRRRRSIHNDDKMYDPGDEEAGRPENDYFDLDNEDEQEE